MQNEEKIRAAIAAYLERNTLISSVSGEKPFECRYEFAADQIVEAIRPHLEAHEDVWKDAPDWAKYRTVDKDGTVTYWDMEPYRSDGEENWKHQNARVNFKEIRYFHSGWENSLQERPR